LQKKKKIVKYTAHGYLVILPYNLTLLTSYPLSLLYLDYTFVSNVLYKDLQKNEWKNFSKYVLLIMCIYVSLCAGVFIGYCTCLLFCTPFIADEELYSWSFDLGASSSSLLIAMICALPLWSFPYLFCLSVERKEIIVWTSLNFLQCPFVDILLQIIDWIELILDLVLI
jgi:ABC-type multidrug transport system permease subunit